MDFITYSHVIPLSLPLPLSFPCLSGAFVACVTFKQGKAVLHDLTPSAQDLPKNVCYPYTMLYSLSWLLDLLQKSLSEVLYLMLWSGKGRIIMNVPSDCNVSVHHAFLQHLTKWNGLTSLAKQQYLLKILKLTNEYSNLSSRKTFKQLILLLLMLS